jgi:hypothetical protein
MEGHTLIYMIFILAYLYYLSRVIDRFNGLLKKRNKIKKPTDNRKESKKNWMDQVRSTQHEMSKLFKRSIYFIFIIPLVEVSIHFVVGGYESNGQLLTLGFFLIFMITLLITLYVYKVKSKVVFEGKFDWDQLENDPNSDLKLS